jgi:hypothetical protein
MTLRRRTAELNRPNSGIFPQNRRTAAEFPTCPFWVFSDDDDIAATAADYLAPGIGTVVPACDLPCPVLAPALKVPAFNHRQQRTAFKSDTGRSA